MTGSTRSTVAGDDHADIFPLSQVYEGLLLKMGEKGNDGGQFFTPREVIRAMVRAIDPETGRDGVRPVLRHGRLPGAGVRAHARPSWAKAPRRPAGHAQASRPSLRPREGKPDLPDRAGQPGPARHRPPEHLARQHAHRPARSTAACSHGAPALFDVILTNPPFGGKESADAQTRFAYQTGATQVLFLQHVIDSLKPGGRCGMVLDEGVLFRTNENAFVQTKRKLLDDCDLWCRRRRCRPACSPRPAPA